MKKVEKIEKWSKNDIIKAVENTYDNSMFHRIG